MWKLKTQSCSKSRWRSSETRPWAETMVRRLKLRTFGVLDPEKVRENQELNSWEANKYRFKMPIHERSTEYGLTAWNYAWALAEEADRTRHQPQPGTMASHSEEPYAQVGEGHQVNVTSNWPMASSLGLGTGSATALTRAKERSPSCPRRSWLWTGSPGVRRRQMKTW